MPVAMNETSEMAILQRVVDSKQPNLLAAASQAILRLDFSVADRARMTARAAKTETAI
jgi:hypothetical protein